MGPERNIKDGGVEAARGQEAEVGSPVGGFRDEVGEEDRLVAVRA